MKRFKHNLGNMNKWTGDMGLVYPMKPIEVLPNDTVQMSTNMLLRLSPLTAPVYHHVNLDLYHFFCPTRLAVQNANEDGTSEFDWEAFITGGPDGTDAQTIPTADVTETRKTIWEYFGIKPKAGLDLNAIPMWAYNSIMNEFFRDQDVQQIRSMNDNTLFRSCWSKDYYTVARTFEQRGPSITLPLGESAPVTYDGVSTSSTQLGVFSTNDNAYQGLRGDGGATTDEVFAATGDTPDHNLYADLKNATSATVNDLRRSLALQRFQEARARYGARLSEYLRYQGATPQDARLDRPEFLAAGRTPINFSEILQTGPEATAPTGTNYGVGDMFGHGIAAIKSNKFRRYVPEHGYIVSLAVVRPKMELQDGVDRTFLKRYKEDFFQKELQYIGQQPLYAGEIDAFNSIDPYATFGFIDRYSDYSFNKSTVAGDFRDLLNFWHMSREFSSEPALNKQFIECTPTKRIFNVQDNDVLWAIGQNRCVARRNVQPNATPRIL